MAQMQRSSDRAWRKSTFSEAGNCVEVACEEHVVLVRDSMDCSGPVSEIPTSKWRTFITDVKAGDFDCAHIQVD
jgi:hypothetical protein